MEPLSPHLEAPKSIQALHSGSRCLRDQNGEVLSQRFGEKPKHHPVGFFSKQLSPALKKKWHMQLKTPWNEEVASLSVVGPTSICQAYKSWVNKDSQDSQLTSSKMGIVLLKIQVHLCLSPRVYEYQSRFPLTYTQLLPRRTQKSMSCHQPVFWEH